MRRPDFAMIRTLYRSCPRRTPSERLRTCSIPDSVRERSRWLRLLQTAQKLLLLLMLKPSKRGSANRSIRHGRKREAEPYGYLVTVAPMIGHLSQRVVRHLTPQLFRFSDSCNSWPRYRSALQGLLLDQSAREITLKPPVH